MVRQSRGPYLAPAPKGGNLEIRWSEGGRSYRRSTGTSDPVQAQKVLAHFIVLKECGEPEPVATASSVLVSELLTTYRDEHVENKVASKETADFIIDRLNAFFGPLAVADIMPYHIDEFVARRRRQKKIDCPPTKKRREPYQRIVPGAKDSTIERDLTVLRAAINYAVKKRRISADITPSIEHLAGSPPKDRWLRREEADALLAAANMRWSARSQEYIPSTKLTRVYKFVAIALATAARKSAILELTKDQVDLAQRRIHFNPPGRAQTKKRRVAVPISDWLLPIMEQAMEEAPTGKYLIGMNCIRSAFEGAVARAGLVDVTPHTLRHTWACWAAQAGVSLYEIAGVLGDTLTTVQANYLHHCPDHLRGAVNFDRRAA